MRQILLQQVERSGEEKDILRQDGHRQIHGLSRPPTGATWYSPTERNTRRHFSLNYLLFDKYEAAFLCSKALAAKLHAFVGRFATRGHVSISAPPIRIGSTSRVNSTSFICFISAATALRCLDMRLPPSQLLTIL
jgi:hypothetical protein